MSLTKILVVDDSKLMHRMYDVMLRSYARVDAFDGREALSCLEEQPDIGLVLLDINMPVMNGLEFLRAMRSDPRWSEIPVIIISTEGKEQDTLEGLQAGASAYVTKPFQTAELLATIDTATKPQREEVPR